MAYKRADVLALPGKSKRVYSLQELIAFDDKVKKYKTEKGFTDWDRLYKDDKLATDRGVVCYEILRDKDANILSANIPMTEQLNLEDQWQSWLRRQATGKRYSLAQLDTVALQSGFKAPEIEKSDRQQAENEIAWIAENRKKNDF